MANQLFVQHDKSRTFIFNNEYLEGSFTAAATETLPIGTLMGRVSATGKLVALDSSATDGSQYPVGILDDDYDVVNGETSLVSICIGGDVVENKVILAAGDTLNTVIEDRRLRDRIAADTLGIKLVPSTEMTAADNS